ncbi:membrane protein [Microbacterium phage LuzDeMundo]|nr:membrane protein [Microbacterium phage DesireeRose]UVG34194.1 membrane protein [Microbacterium phage LuzDeMundo]
MKSDATQVLLITGVAAAINGVYKVQRKEDAIPSLVATGLVATSLVVFGGLIRRYDLSAALAFVFLMAVLIARGIPMLSTAQGLIGGSKPIPAGKSLSAPRREN